MSRSNRQRCWSGPVLAIGLGIALAVPGVAAEAGADYEREIEEWRRQRVERLTSEDAWVTLVGLHWLRAGENRVGADPDLEVPLPAGKAPARLGSLFVDDGRVRLEVAPGVEVRHEGQPVGAMTLATDGGSRPTVLEHGDLSFHVIDRDGQLAARVRDRRHPARFDFPGIESFPVAPEWRLEARFEPYDPVKRIPIPTALGGVTEQPSWGAVVFEAGGATHRLDAVAEPGAEELFLIFGDATSGKETYGGGRYLYAPAPDAEGRVVLDFNKAYNPPCVFTPYATCPLPPRQNRLAVRVEAGEKTFGAP